MTESCLEVKVEDIRKNDVENLLKNLKKMSLKELRKEYQKNPPNGFSKNWDKKALQKILKSQCLKEFPEFAIKNPSKKTKPKIELKVNFLVVIDFECTCERLDPDNQIKTGPFFHEIIEFPAVIIDVSKRAIIAEFRKFVKPKVNPVLSQFCMQLTGVKQEDIDTADTFPIVLESFQKFLKIQGLHQKDGELNYLMVTDGIGDIGNFFQIAISSNDLEFPPNFCQIIDIRQIAKDEFGLSKSIYFLTLEKLLKKAGIEFEGRTHCGIDDTRNIAQFIIHFLNNNVGFYITHQLVKKEQVKLYPIRCHFKPDSKRDAWYAKSIYGVVQFKYKDIEKQIHKICEISG